MAGSGLSRTRNRWRQISEFEKRKIAPEPNSWWNFSAKLSQESHYIKLFNEPDILKTAHC